MFEITKLRELKLRLYNEKNLSKIWEFYMDYFADHVEFTNLGQPTSHSLLEQVVPILSKQLVGEKSQDLFLILIPDYQFIHGSFTVKNSIGGVIYFEESLKGMVAVSEFPPSNMVKYSRFTGEPINHQTMNGNPMN